MTKEQQLAYCKSCSLRKMDGEKGLVCSLTSEKADFIHECPDYKYDPSVDLQLDHVQEREWMDLKKILYADNFERLRLEQNLPLAIFGGFMIGIMGAIIWATITLMADYRVGFMSIALGALIGFSIRYFGKGIDKVFGVLGAVIAVFCCLFGNFLVSMGYIANAEDLEYMEALFLFDYNYIIQLIADSSNYWDLVFYIIAAIVGYRLAFRNFTKREIAEMS
ncbi:hypothetical protein KZP23_06165 [Echinicola marina]|uniref:hypothetical protein n=1 Tax=Echinicola marina TaxID=2859768 RepID=UPI001CF6DA9C|nr:hypothetical protein [Echinicola marina]UCS94602.1 hypothetical protein KZP23_06165 [Echinicola marina]